MSKIPCEVIKDLMPLYVEGLTSEVTGNEIGEHLSQCEKCNKIFENMKLNETEVRDEVSEKVEIDFLKKNKRHNRLIAFICVISAFIVIIGAVLAGRYLIGNKGAYNDKLQYKLEVSGGKIALEARMNDAGLGISDVRFTPKGDTLYIDVYTVSKSIFHKDVFGTEYEMDKEPVQIIINDNIAWYEGEYIDKYVSQVYKTGHLYVGDMSANMKTADAIGVYAYLGPYTNELSTKEEPYAWTIILENEIDPGRYDDFQKKMQYIGVSLIGLIDNLDSVNFRFVSGGESRTYSITESQADLLAGFSVKNSRTQINMLNQLIKALKV